MATNNAITWDNTGERWIETGVRKGVLFVQENGVYGAGVAWNGLTAITESPSGAELNDLYADDIKYASLRSAETFGATVEAYTYPDEFAKCDGSAEPADGVKIGQQSRAPFALCYVTQLMNDTMTDTDDAYILHIIYNATASPSEKAYQTINDSPDAITFSWELNTTPVNVTGYKPTSLITIDSRKADKTKLAALEKKLYGDGTTKSALPTPDEVITMMKKTT